MHQVADTGFMKQLGEHLKPAYLGLGFVWAWVYCSFETPSLFPLGNGFSINIDASWSPSAIAVSLVLVAVGCFAGGRISCASRRLLVCSAIAVCLGSLISWAALFFSAALPLSILGGILGGIGSALLLLLWGDALSHLDFETAELVIPCSAGIVAVCALAYPLLDGAFGLLVALVLPLLSGLCLLLGRFDELDEVSAELALDEGLDAGLDAELEATAAVPASAAKRSRSLGLVWGAGACADADVRAGAIVELVRIGVAVAIVYSVLGCMSALYANRSYIGYTFIDLPTFLGNAFGVALALWFVNYSSRVSITALVRWLMPLIALAIGVSSIATPTWDFIGGTLSTVADVTLQSILFLCVVYWAKRGQVPAVVGTGVAVGISQAGIFFGNLAGARLVGYAFAGDSNFGHVLVALFVLLSITLWVLPQDKPFSKQKELLPVLAGEGSVGGAVQGVAEGARFAEAADGTDSAVEERVVTGADSADAVSSAVEDMKAARTQKLEFDAACELVILKYQLTRREGEVFMFLARGRSQNYIREQLVLSKNTVSTHVRHIYTKLDVHSREELIDLVQGELAEE